MSLIFLVLFFARVITGDIPSDPSMFFLVWAGFSIADALWAGVLSERR